MTQFASPVLHSLLDTDAYKLHMQQAVFHHYYYVHVAAEFRCRGDDLLGIYADAIREQVQAMQHLRLQDDEYQWLSALPFFQADYLNWLREFRFNPEQVTVSNDNGKLDIRLSGPWREVILWEVPLLAVISDNGTSLSLTADRRCASPRHAGKQISRLLGINRRS